MKRCCRSLLALLLAALLACGGTFAAFARESEEPDVQTTSSFGKGNALNAIVSGLSSEADDAQYGVVKVEIGDDAADVTLNCAGTCTLVVAIYTESGGEMLDCAVQTVEANETFATVSLADMELPEYYTVKAFLLDENNCALCKNYESRTHTQAYKDYLEKCPEDFAGEEVLIFDDDKEQEDFAVLTDEVQTASDTGSMTFAYDESTLTFTFTNATQQVKSLKVGDMFYWEYGDDGAYLLFKVRSIAVSGSTVEIVEDEDVSLEELFDFVRIDEGADFSKFSLTDENMGEAMELVPSVSAQADIDTGDKTSFSTEFKLTFPKKKEDNDPTPVGGKLTGTGKLFLTTSVKLFYDAVLFGKDYFEFEHTLEIGIDITVTASVALDFTPYLTLKAIPEIPIGSTGITIKIEPAVVLKVTASFSVTGKLTYKVTTTADRDNGLQKAQDVSFKPSANAQAKIEVQIGIQITVKVSWIKTISLEISGGGGAKIPMQVQLVGALADKYHDCIFCLDGEIDFYVEISGKLKLSPLKLFDKEWTIVKFEKTWKWKDFYVSVSTDGVHCGIGEHCDRIYHKVTVVVQEKTNSICIPVENADVECQTAMMLQDDKLVPLNIGTGSDGKAEIYCTKGTHELTVRMKGYMPKTISVNVLEIEKTVSVVFGDEDTVPVGDLSYYRAGETFLFGSYPQSQVTDAATLKTLNNLSLTWSSYQYYSGTGETADGNMQPADYMKYADVQLGDYRYRAVRFTAYRPITTDLTAQNSYTGENSRQKAYGFVTNKTYWFVWEPVEWIVLDPDQGLAISNMIIDGQPFQNYLSGESCDDQNHDANDYYYSSIRSWLNESFYQAAFNEQESDRIAEVSFSNYRLSDMRFDQDRFDDYFCSGSQKTYEPSNNDKVFLLSLYPDLQSYCFSKNATNTDPKRSAEITDYGKCQGGNTYWCSRTGCVYKNVFGVDSNGCLGERKQGWTNPYYVGNCLVVNTVVGVRPAIVLTPEAIKSKTRMMTAAKKEGSQNTRTVQKGARYTASQSGTVAGNEYVLLVRQAGTSGIAAEDLYYIDQQTAAGSSVTFTYVPRISGECTVEIFGEFAESQPVAVTVETVTDSGSTVEGAGTYTVGDTVTLTAHPAGKDFLEGWYMDGKCVSSETAYTFTAEKDVTVKAVFLHPVIGGVTLGDRTERAKASFTLTPEVQANGADYTLAYTSSNPKIAEVDANGNVTTHKQGEAKITVTATDEYGNAVSDTCTVIVRYTWWQWLIVVLLFGWIWYR